MWSGDFNPIGEETYHWYKMMLEVHGKNREAQTGVCGIERDKKDLSIVIVYVGENTDLSDKTLFPDKLGEDIIRYHTIPIPR